MPRFLTRDEFFARKGEARVTAYAGGDLAVVDAAIDRAEAEAVARLVPRYGDKLPTNPASTPDVLKDQVADIALERVLDGHDQVAPNVTDAARTARTFLRDVGRGQADLGLPDQPDVDVTTPAILVTKPASEAALTLQSLKDW